MGGVNGFVVTAVVGVLGTMSPLISVATANAAPPPATVIATMSAPVVSLAVGGGRVAFRTRRKDWFGNICHAVHVVALEGGRSAAPRQCPVIGHSLGHAFIPEDGGTGVAVSARSLAYDSITVGILDATHDEADSVLWRVGQDRKRRLAHEFYELTCWGAIVGQFAAAGGIAFTRTTQTEVDPAMECQLGSGGGPGVSSMTGADLRFVATGTTAVKVIHGAPGAARIAASGSTVAILPLQLPQPMGNAIRPPGARLSEVQSWNVAAGTRWCRTALAAPAVAVAIKGREMAVVVPGTGGNHLIRLSSRTCRKLGRRLLPTGVSAEVALGRRFAAWATARSVFALDLNTGHVIRVHTGKLAPRGLAITGGCLVWWVNGPGHSRVLRMRLP
jgi:hypothetical protein